MSTPNSSWARVLTAFVVFAAFGLAVWVAERVIEASDPDLLVRDPVSGDDGMKFYRIDPVLGLFHKSDFTADYRGVKYSTNSLGARNEEIPYAREPGRRRLVVLGDSIVWGFGVPNGETLCDYLARALQATDVVNLGVAGYGTGQELVLLQHEGFRYAPDDVLLVFTLANDVEDTYFPDSAESYPANLFHLDHGVLRIDRFETTPRERLGLWLSHHSYLVKFLATRFGRGRVAGRGGTESARRTHSAIGAANLARLEAIEPDLSPYAGLAYLQPLASEPRETDGDGHRRYARRGGPLRPDAPSYYKVELVKQVLLAIAQTGAAHGARLTVALAPYAAELELDARDRLNVELLRFLRAEGIEGVDLLPTLRDAAARGARQRDSLYLDSVHFSPRGNRVVARRLAEALAAPVGP